MQFGFGRNRCRRHVRLPRRSRGGLPLFDRLRARRRNWRASQMQEEIRHSRALYQVAAAINSTLDPSSVLMTIVHGTATAMGVKGCSIMLLSSDRKELRHSAHFGLSDRYVMKGPVRMDPELEATLTGGPATVLHASTDPRVQYRQEATEEG